MDLRIKKTLLLYWACALAGAQLARAETPIRLMNAGLPGSTLSESVISRIRAEFDLPSYREVRILEVFNSRGESDHLLVYRFVKGFHKVELSSLRLDHQNRLLSRQDDYQLQNEDIAQSATSRVSDAQCPDSSVEFIAFAPNPDDVEQQVTEEVAQAAEGAHLKTVRLLRNRATRQNYLNYMACPRLQGNFYDGDANTGMITTVDAVITSHEISSVLKGAYRHRVTNIWLACEAYNDPILSSVERTAQSQKYAAGINDLAIGPSDRAAACAMEAAILGLPMTQSFEDCYAKLDNGTDRWGFGGEGSDFFGH